MKLALLGGGGFRVPLVYKALLADDSDARVTELRLYDTDARRLSVISAAVAELAKDAPAAPHLIITDDLRTALEGADFVFSAIRVGGTEGRALDEQLSLRHGVIGQETVGAGGISYALRGIPVVLDLVEQIQQHAPDAWVINFTNPAGVMTEVMRRRLGDRVVGICDSPVGLARRVVDTLKAAGLADPDLPAPGTGSDRIHVRYAGLNHLGWLTGLDVDGVDLLPRLLERADLIESFEEGKLFRAPLIQAIGAVPNEYLHYYYYAREDLAADRSAAHTRGAFLAQQQCGFYDRAVALGADPRVLSLWEQTRLNREQTYMATNREASGRFERAESDLGSGGYEHVALAIMHAIANDVPAELILNVANRGLLPGLDDDAVVEVPCRVDRTGVHALPDAFLPAHARGLVTSIKYVERRTIDAAVNRSRHDALLALAHHPLMDSFTVAQSLLDDFVQNFPELDYLREVRDA